MPAAPSPPHDSMCITTDPCVGTLLQTLAPKPAGLPGFWVPDHGPHKPIAFLRGLFESPFLRVLPPHHFNAKTPKVTLPLILPQALHTPVPYPLPAGASQLDTPTGTNTGLP